MDSFETVLDTSVSHSVQTQPTGVTFKYLNEELIIRHYHAHYPHLPWLLRRSYINAILERENKNNNYNYKKKILIINVSLRVTLVNCCNNRPQPMNTRNLYFSTPILFVFDLTGSLFGFTRHNRSAVCRSTVNKLTTMTVLPPPPTATDAVHTPPMPSLPTVHFTFGMQWMFLQDPPAVTPQHS